MYFFEKHKKMSIIIGTALVILIVMGISVLAGGTFFAENLFNTVVSPIQNGITAVTDGVGGFFNFLFEMKDYKEENTRLSKRVAELEREQRSVQDYREENERLSGLLDLKENDYSNLRTTGATIIGWSTDNWFNYYTIDKGSLDGVQEKSMVLTDEGLVGHVQEVGLNWSRIVTIVDSSSSVGAKVVRTGDVALVTGDNAYEKQGLCKMVFINKESQIVVGDIIETSGLGGVYTAGVPIGRVQEIITDSTGVSQYALIEPLVDFNATRHVLVVLDTVEGQDSGQ